MLKVTVVKSQSGCATCEETGRIVEEIARSYSKDVELEVLTIGTPETKPFGVITTPTVIINNKIYAMGKPVIKEKVETWIKKELGGS